MGKKSKKQPQHKAIPRHKKIPRIDPNIKPNISDTPVWQAGNIDLDGPWGWKNIENRIFFDNILPKIQNFESMHWDEILNRNNHEVKVEKISKEAQSRLTELRLDDFDRLVSLRLAGQQRVWGIKSGNIFKILWWDPEHEVFPSKLKHT